MPPLPYTTDEISFEHAGDMLAGTLYLPQGGGPHPALVMIQGSGPTDRTNFDYFPPIAEHFASHGIAVLCYDKPGEGSSGGNWHAQTLRDRAHEVLAAHAYLRGRPEINPKAVGLYGFSQGGWVAPLAASLSPDVAFVVPVSGPGIPPGLQDAYGIANRGATWGFTEAQIADALALYQTFREAARRGEPYAVVSSMIKAAGSPVFDRYMSYLDESSWQFFSGKDAVTGLPAVDYDPQAALRKVQCPLLGIFGEVDDLVPASASAAIYRRELSASGNADFLTKVFRSADHRIKVNGELAPGYLDLMTDWIRARTGA